jgi:hypothetical protein
MPGFDGTGPQGMGPRTGGGRVFCPPGAETRTGYGQTGPFLRGAGRGGIPWGGGRGRVYGGGRGRGYYRTIPFAAQHFYHEPNAAQTIEFLKNQASLLEGELAALQKRIEELGKKENNA